MWGKQYNLGLLKADDANKNLVEWKHNSWFRACKKEMSNDELLNHIYCRVNDSKFLYDKTFCVFKAILWFTVSELFQTPQPHRNHHPHHPHRISFHFAAPCVSVYIFSHTNTHTCFIILLCWYLKALFV
jgi:hypothetical protein